MSPGEPRVSMAVVGFGRFGRLHADIVARHPRASLSAIVEPTDSGRDEASRRHPEALLVGDMADLVAAPVDAIIITSPEETHSSICRQAFDAGMHVFSEKPLATDFHEASELVEVSKAAGRVYQAGYILRYDSRHRRLWELVRRERRIGDVAVITAKRNISRSWFESYGFRTHPVYETLVHDIDLAIWLSGSRARTVSAWARSFLGREVPETFSMVIEFENDSLAILETAWLVPSGAPPNITDWGGVVGVIDARVEVTGLEGTGAISSYEPSFHVSTPNETIFPETAMWPVIGGQVGGALRDEVWEFIARVQGDANHTIASIDDALHVQEVADAAIMASEQHRPVSLLA